MHEIKRFTRARREKLTNWESFCSDREKQTEE